MYNSSYNRQWVIIKIMKNNYKKKKWIIFLKIIFKKYKC